MFNKILVALDSSEIANDIFEKALDIAKVNGAEMMLLHVVSLCEAPYPMYVYPNTVIYSLHDEAIKQHIRDLEKIQQKGIEFLTSLCNRAIACGVKSEFTQTIGNPGRIICEMAGNYNADLVIIGRRGHTGLSELFLGSVSNYVLHHVPCSILTVQKLVKTNPEELKTVETISV